MITGCGSMPGQTEQEPMADQRTEAVTEAIAKVRLACDDIEEAWGKGKGRAMSDERWERIEAAAIASKVPSGGCGRFWRRGLAQPSSSDDRALSGQR